MEEMDDLERPKKAGSIRRISVENFMCHSSLTIELGDRVNFITGQNGSGKSAILTALCVAFGIKAKGTQRANSVKDFIKNGCRYGLVVVELNNEGEDAFKPGLFGDAILVERRINESSSTFSLKDIRGRRLGTKKEDILEVVEHFNIEVENPCVVMTQDKSREFLHGGSDKDKFKFFFKATLLQHVSELLSEWEENLAGVVFIVKDLMTELQPQKNELKQIEDQLKTLEQVEALRSDIEKLEKIYAWSWVNESKAALRDAEKKLTDLKNRIPVCQKKIDDAKLKADSKREAHAERQAFIAKLIHDTQELRQSQDKLQMALTEATREKVQADEEMKRVKSSLQQTMGRLHRCECDIADMHQRMEQDTQAALNDKLNEISALEDRKRTAEDDCKRLLDEEGSCRAKVEVTSQQKAAINKEVESSKAQLRDLKNYMGDLQSQQTNTVTAFGGPSVLRLLQAIEENHQRFSRPPLGPIGAHVGLLDDRWSLAVEVAIGGLLNDFVVTNHKDFLLLSDLSKRVGYRYLGVKTFDFDVPLLRPTSNDLPDGSLLTLLASLQSENATIMNVLIDKGHVEQKVLARDYNEGKNVAFNGVSRNVKEVITADGTKMYTRAGAETILFKDRRIHSGRIGVRVDDKIMQAHIQERDLNDVIRDAESRKRKIDNECSTFNRKADFLKRQRTEGERNLRRQELKLHDLKTAVVNETEMNKETSMIELEQEIVQIRGEIEQKEDLLSKSEIRLQEVMCKYAEAKSRLEQLCESARGDFESLHGADQDLVTLEEELNEAEESVKHFQKIMEQRVIAEIQSQEQITEDKRKALEKDLDQASQICPEEERLVLGEDNRTREQLSNHITRLNERVKKQENESEALEQLIKKGNKIRRKIASREKWFINLEQKLDILQGILAERKKLYRKNCVNLRRELTWGFNGHLRRKGFSGHVKVDYENKTLNMSVQMPQDASNTSVKDTRALSGGERSYSTLAFALAVHNMTEAPFRAMDEFDVFMDAVSRKISLDTVVEFALQEGSQWIFITPHDISMVKGTEHVKKQQMPAPRP